MKRMKLLCLPLATIIVFILSGCQSDFSKQKKWIYANIEEKVWQEKTLAEINYAFTSLKEDAQDYIDAQINICQSAWNNSDAKDERELDMLFGNSWRELVYLSGAPGIKKKMQNEGS